MIIERSINKRLKITIAVDRIHVRGLDVEDLDYREGIAIQLFDYLHSIGEIVTMRTQKWKGDGYPIKLRSKSGNHGYDIYISKGKIKLVNKFIS